MLENARPPIILKLIVLSRDLRLSFAREGACKVAISATVHVDDLFVVGLKSGCDKGVINFDMS